MKKHLKDFLEFIGIDAIKYLLDEGFDPAIVISQSALETGWSKSQLSLVSKNLFGIKGKGLEWTTKEYQGGWTTIKTQFKHYNSTKECMQDYVSIIKRLYPSAYKVRNDPVAYIKEVAKRWATDPNYVDKILAIYNTYKEDIQKWINENLSKT